MCVQTLMTIVWYAITWTVLYVECYRFVLISMNIEIQSSHIFVVGARLDFYVFEGLVMAQRQSSASAGHDREGIKSMEESKIIRFIIIIFKNR